MVRCNIALATKGKLNDEYYCRSLNKIMEKHRFAAIGSGLWPSKATRSCRCPAF